MQLSSVYWPRERGPHWWLEFSVAAARAELEMAAEAGVRSLHVLLLWSDFQPNSDRVAAGAMRHLETTLDIAAQFEVEILLRLMPVAFGSRAWLPGWLLDPLSWGDGSVVGGHLKSRRAPINLFESETARRAATRLVRETVAAFDEHPSVSGWMLGDRLSTVSRPRSVAIFERWLGTVADEARQARATKPLFHGISGRELVQSSVVDVTVMSKLGIIPAIAMQWRPEWARTGERTWVSFLAGYAAALSEAAGTSGPGTMLLDEIGCPLDTEAISERVRGAVEGGASQYVVPALFNYSADLRNAPPFDQTATLLDCGLLDRRGGLTKAGRAFIEAQVVPGQVAARHDLFPPLDPDARMRAPEAFARECYDEMLR